MKSSRFNVNCFYFRRQTLIFTIFQAVCLFSPRAAALAWEETAINRLTHFFSGWECAEDSVWSVSSFILVLLSELKKHQFCISWFLHNGLAACRPTDILVELIDRSRRFNCPLQNVVSKRSTEGLPFKRSGKTQGKKSSYKKLDLIYFAWYSPLVPTGKGEIERGRNKQAGDSPTVTASAEDGIYMVRGCYLSSSFFILNPLAFYFVLVEPETEARRRGNSARLSPNSRTVDRKRQLEHR